MQAVIDKTTKIVKRWGYTDFSNNIDPNTEQIVTYDGEFVFSPPVGQKTWTWNGSTFV